MLAFELALVLIIFKNSGGKRPESDETNADCGS